MLQAIKMAIDMYEIEAGMVREAYHHTLFIVNENVCRLLKKEATQWQRREPAKKEC